MRLRILVLSSVVLSALAFGQPPDVYQIHHFANTRIGDSYIDLTNAGALPGVSLFAGTAASVGGSLCVNAYAFAADEQMIACCSCPLTPNGASTLSVQNDLLNNVLEPQLPVNGLTVALTATAPVANSCAGSAYAGATLAPGLVAWGTTLHANTSVTPAAVQNLYVASSSSVQVLQFNGSTGAFVNTFVPAGSGGLTLPYALTFGSDGNLYVSSESGNQVLQYNGATGAFLSTFVSTASGGLLDPFGLTFGPDGNLYVASQSNQVLRYNGSTGAFLNAFVAAGSGGLSEPTSLTFGPDGNLYVASQRNSQVLRYSGSTGAFLSAFVPSGSGGLVEPTGLAFGPDGNLYVTSLGTNQVLRYNGSTGAFLSAFVPSGSGGLNEPYSLIFGPDGNLYVASLGSGQVLQYNGNTGAFLSVFVPAGSGGLSFPISLVFGASHTQSAAAYSPTETPFVLETLSPGEASRLIELCTFLNADGSGYGVCNSCNPGALGATRK
jgi:WD40 repeat protein